MLTPTEIDAGTARLDTGKLKPEDVDAMASAFEMMFTGLTSEYGYEYEESLEELDDLANGKKKAAQVAGVLIKLEDLGFTMAKLRGGRSALEYSQSDEYRSLVLFAFSKIYPIPKEFANFSLKYASWFNRSRTSSTIPTTRAL